MRNTCWKEDPPFKQCCCNCVYHRPVYSHPWYPTDLEWVCAVVHDGETHVSSSQAHSVGCELHTVAEDVGVEIGDKG